MDKFIRIPEFVQSLFPDENTAQQASQIIEGIMTARSPRLSEIASKIPGEEAACYKRIQRFLYHIDPQAALQLMFNEEADFVIADPTEIERPHARRTPYVGTLKDGQISGFWMLPWPLPCEAEPFLFTF